MTKHDLVMMDEKELIWACVEPMILKTRGKSGQEKLLVYRQMKSGQRALYMCQVLLGHMDHGVNGFYQQFSYLTDQVDIWSALKAAMLHFGNTKMHGLIGQMEAGYLKRETSGAGETSLEEMNSLYQEILPETLRQIKSRVLEQPEEYLPPEE